MSTVLITTYLPPCPIVIPILKTVTTPVHTTQTTVVLATTVAPQTHVLLIVAPQTHVLLIVAPQTHVLRIAVLLTTVILPTDVAKL